ncbi:MAG: radical SAM additional 4Fe4S-binding SPASM domain-containing protein [Rhodobacteraceae bacterium HLUCCA24]|nr:MAG: radical SAM additional 4Fe4S-binding SPASM domain-containing protein [Rhodobacteraceae bacterium HLUCCA24]
MLDENVIDAPIPQYFNIEVSSHCNLKCPYCPTGRGDIPMADRRYISDADFHVIFENIRPYAEVIQLFNWGEPFMHKSLCSYLERISSHGILTQISSNLSVRRFDDRAAERIVASGLTSLFASIDGITQQAYEAYRVNGNVSVALQNLETVRRARDRLGSSTPHLIWGFYVNRHNEHEVDAARRKADEIGVDIWFKELSCPPEFQTTLLRSRPDLFAAPGNLGELWRGRFNRGLGHFELDPRLPRTCNVCRMPFEIMIINTDGTVFPCTAVTGRQFAVGNLLTESVEDVWHNRMVENRRQLLHVEERREQSQCRRCPHFPT